MSFTSLIPLGQLLNNLAVFSSVDAEMFPSETPLASVASYFHQNQVYNYGCDTASFCGRKFVVFDEEEKVKQFDRFLPL